MMFVEVSGLREPSGGLERHRCMDRHEFLSAVHERYRPRSYLEIGIDEGHGLARSATRTIGVDPHFHLTTEVACDLKLVRATSDEFFARPDAISWFPEEVVDLTFIDGLHLFEFALRDFMNAERTSGPCSAIIFDDIFPRSVAEASRERHTLFWAGDTYKVMLALERFRPDLAVIPLDTQPTGLLLVLGLDPESKVLAARYEDIVAEYAARDPQRVPDEVLCRKNAADPKLVVNSDVWRELAAGRDGGIASSSLSALRSLRGTAKFSLVPPEDEVWPARPRRLGRVRRQMARLPR
jgi:hypothetical protein